MNKNKKQTSQKNATKVVGPTRADRGRRIFEHGGQVRRIDDIEYEVKSQTWPDRAYAVFRTERGWICSCPDHLEAGHTCKHIHAVDISIRMRQAVQTGTTIRQVDPTKCKHCGSHSIIRDCIRHFKKGDVQQYRCKDCKKRFTHNLGFEGKRATPEQVSTGIELLFAGMSTRKVATTLKGMGVTISHQTVLNWATQYAEIMERFADKILPRLGEQWRTDEVYVSVKGNPRYIFAMLDTETRYWIAKMVAEHKGNDDVAPMFAKAKDVAGKAPETLVSDGAANFHHAWREQYAPRNFLDKDTIHINQVEFDGVHHNNQMESFNGNTIRHREKVIRGLKREDSAILTGLQLYHNYVRGHLGLADHATPAEAAGINVQGDNKFLTMIQAAVQSD
ncbi:MAG: IS1/IS6 family transposase [Thaumarchaeota archaeon]|nr:IS1/IS6 family transposase [Nitrososphaerota archaeon]